MQFCGVEGRAKSRHWRDLISRLVAGTSREKWVTYRAIPQIKQA